MAALQLLNEHRCFGGVQRFYRHDSREIGLPMQFAVYLPPQAEQGPVPVLIYLAGLTCTEETATIKAGAQQWAAQHGLALVMPDTSPRGANLPGDSDSWDFGVGRASIWMHCGNRGPGITAWKAIWFMSCRMFCAACRWTWTVWAFAVIRWAGTVR